MIRVVVMMMIVIMLIKMVCYDAFVHGGDNGNVDEVFDDG